MLSAFTKDKPRLRRICSYLFVGTLIITLFFGIIWIQNPATDNTASQLSEIKQILVNNNRETNQRLQDLTDKIDKLIQVLEAQNVSGNTTPAK